jgi:FtsX-like permease family
VLTLGLGGTAPFSSRPHDRYGIAYSQDGVSFPYRDQARHHALRVLRRRSGSGPADLRADARRPAAAGTLEEDRRLPRPELLLGRDDGTAEAGSRPRAAQAALAGPFGLWVVTTARSDVERANLPELRLAKGAAGLDSLRRQFSKPLYLLLSMVGLILAIACANTASLLLARAATRTREMAVRISLGAGRWRVVRQLLTESVLLAALSAALGVVIAMAGIRLLTGLLANGREGFTLHAELNGHVLGVTLALSFACGVLFGLAPRRRWPRPD